MEFTSQVGQDKWVCEFFNYKHGGYFIDIGANDGIWLSNTYYLEKELGWTGICIEAGQVPFKSLLLNRDCTCIRKYISDKNEMTQFEEIHYSSRPRLEGWQPVESMRLDTLMAQYDIPRVIDYISLDVDGPDYEALSSFPFNEHQVILWTLEHNNITEMKEKMKKIMKDNGYIIAMEDVKDANQIFEDWYINKDYARV
jgi:FkbM family methyltransferase